MSERWRNMDVFELDEGSTATLLKFTLKKKGVALNLSAATGSLYFHCKDDEGVEITTQGTSAWFTDGSDGLITHQMLAIEVDTLRTYTAQFEVQGYNGGNLKSRPFRLRIVPGAIGVAP